MDWELYDRFRATLSFAVLLLLSFFLLAFQQSYPVSLLKSVLVRGVLPTERLLYRLSRRPFTMVRPTAPVPLRTEKPLLSSSGDLVPDEQRVLNSLVEENKHLRALLELKKDRGFHVVVAQVVARNPQRWFREILLDKGSEEGLAVDNPVLALEGTREGVVGRIIEAGPHVSKVMLLQDPLSAVAGRVSGAANEDGVVEGMDRQELFLRYLRRDSSVKIGDLVTTSGLGGSFPDGVPIGWVEDMAPDARQLFLETQVRPVILSHSLRLVYVLTKHE